MDCAAMMPDRLARLDELAGRQVATVAQGADAALRLAGQHGTDLDRLDGRLRDPVRLLLVDQLARAGTITFPGQRVDHVVHATRVRRCARPAAP